MKKIFVFFLFAIIGLAVEAQTSPVSYGTPFYIYEGEGSSINEQVGYFYVATDNTLCISLPCLNKTAMIRANSVLKYGKDKYDWDIYGFPAMPENNRAYSIVVSEYVVNGVYFYWINSDEQMTSLLLYNTSNDLWTKLKSTIDSLPYKRIHVTLSE